MVQNVGVALPHKQVALVAEPHHLLDLRIGSDERGAEKFGGGGGFVLVRINRGKVSVISKKA